jgi:lipoprotein-anchoring transpeptidase ErfK/SrfK
MERPACSAVALVTICLTSLAVTAFSQTQPRQPNKKDPGGAVHEGSTDPAFAPLAEALPMLDAKSRRGLALQVALDRAGFSPGEIDAAPGTNTDRAMAAFKTAKGSTDLGEVYANPVSSYTNSAEDVAGPFTEQVPEDMMEKAKLPALSYASALELLAERFHASPKLLQRLNPNATFTQGEMIVVPNVQPFLPATGAATAPSLAASAGNTSSANATARGPQAKPGAATTKPGDARANRPAPDKGLTVTVTDRTKTLEVQNAAGEVIFFAPVTVGSENDPLPVGEWKVNGVSRNPTFNYNPELFWDADPAHAKAKLPAGPNNPVGVVWIDLSKEHYGIHGTPEPSRIGYTESHGCIRLTNWDAMKLADMVTPGTKVVLR